MKIKRLLLGAVGLLVVLVMVAGGIVLVASREPSTTLVDATGQKLTAGAAGESKGLFDEVQTLIEQRAFVPAKEQLLAILDEHDRDGETCILLSDVYRELEDATAAVDYGLKAVELLPESAPAHLAYAKALGLQIFSDMRGIGGMFRAMGRLPRMRSEIDRVIELDPQDVEARSMLVFYYLAPGPMGDLDKAVALSKEIEALDPVVGKQLLAASLQRKKETGQAIELLVAGLRDHPDAVGLHLSLADIYAEEKRFDEADEAFEAARGGAKEGEYYRSLYGQARMRVMNEFGAERAVTLLDEYIAADPDFDMVQPVAYACWRKGNALEQLDRIEDARQAYQESLRRRPGLELAEKALRKLPPEEGG